MKFNYLEFLTDDVFEKLNEIKTFHPEIIESEAMLREKPGYPHEKVVFAAADHNARMINEYKGNPIGLSNRREYLTRLVRMLHCDDVDGVEATPNIIEDLMIINKIKRDAGEKAFLDGKMLICTVNRGGLKGTNWEMDDQPCCATVDRIARLCLDGVKLMIRINPYDDYARHQLKYLADAINEAEKYGLPVFIETLYVETTENGFSMKVDNTSQCKAVGVVDALGCTGANKWLEIPLNDTYEVPCSATTAPVLVVPDEVMSEPLDIVKEYTAQIGLNYNIRGTLLCRNIMYNENDPLPMCEAIADVWHNGTSPEEALAKAEKKYS